MGKLTSTLCLTGWLLAAGSLGGCQPAEQGSPETTFHIDLDITPAARKDIRDAHDKITVDVYYFGMPTPKHQAEADAVGRVRLGDDLFEVGPDATGLTVNGAGIDRKLLSHVTGGVPHVMVGAYSSLVEGAQTDRMDCHDYFGTIAEAKAHRARVTCDVGTP